jgi:hypothetical protein
MKIVFNNLELNIPQTLINKFYKDFDGLPNSRHYDSIIELRDSIENVMDLAKIEPDIIEDPEFQVDFVRAMAMMCAMKKHGIYYDA